ncbi:DUF5343 domain-containing protein [Pseudomonas sp. ZM23]|uniref:DUF5343 domain-containing protein n=1 Tax=Pseudomonas triclosanedens TaxID=2961893 RepID=A0ABY6ZX61_9PSED|nr:DUF5343 domain-containing protein [Pseudomonas triclosanedens]MCP8467847.1 DUF5343 domain-containing protein [Pseudomonas triclosanedens]MCP8469948.1 DUF5343 domain-containing protein [Pseudomonas triclosanedens]MCP8477858.1 DUF5343 domain-containing protein [Pseudomonas triclosanedens]WAI49280.1 DUF5343 domain-containing protein [Pseudomonas triclosanedens]
MANGETSYPKVPDANWWKLRELLKQKVPGTFSGTYVSSALGVSEASAKANIIGPLKKIGLVDDGLKPTTLAYDWRDDDKYPSVCEKIIESQYPQEIRDLYHTAESDPQKVTNWFMNNAKCGMDAAKKYARFYLLMLRADPNEGASLAAKKTATPKTPKTPSKPAKNKASAPSAQLASQADEQRPLPQRETHHEEKERHTRSHLSAAPELHINIQLHISPESTAEQIDKIFESMAKHLKTFKD